MSYGQSLYSLLHFAEPAEDSETTEFAAPDLMRYLPPYYQNSKVMTTLQSAQAEEIGMLNGALADLLRQMFVATATWGLAIWEFELGLIVDPTKPAERRREQLFAKLRGRGTTTRQMIVSTAKAFSGGEVEVAEYPGEYRFEVRFIGVMGIPPNMPGFIAMLEEIKPAHLAYSFSYTYTVWDNLAVLTWGGVSVKTWEQLQVYQTT